MLVYLAADHPLPEIPWDKDSPAFHVTSELEDVRAKLANTFTKRHLYYAGARECCGCGFSYQDVGFVEDLCHGDPDELAEDLADREKSRQDLAKLRDYLMEAVKAGPVELYSVWADDEGHEPTEWYEVTPAFFDGESFEFPERALYLVKREQA